MQTRCTEICQHLDFIVSSKLSSKLSVTFPPVLWGLSLVEITTFIVSASSYCQEILFWWYILVVRCSVVATPLRHPTQLATDSGERKLYFNILSENMLWDSVVGSRFLVRWFHTLCRYKFVFWSLCPSGKVVALEYHHAIKLPFFIFSSFPSKVHHLLDFSHIHFQLLSALCFK